MVVKNRVLGNSVTVLVRVSVPYFLTFRLFCGGCKGKSSFLKYLQGSHEKKSISKNSLGHEVFSHKKIFFLRPVLSPLQRREPKKPFPRKTLKMVLNDASQKAMFVLNKTFFFTLMNKVRVSFSVFFFSCENLS